MARTGGKVPTKAGEGSVTAFLEKLATTPAPATGGRRGRLIFAMDATASRQPRWDSASHIQSQMFVETAQLGGLDIQLVFYRGFGEFHAAPWHHTADALLAEMRQVFCVGGRTQIGKVLRHARDQAKKGKVDALVFVGDCMEEDVDALCHTAGELGLMGVPCFIFHEGGEPNAAMAFKQIAHLTRGAYCRFDAASAQQLRDLLAAVAVFAAGGRKALADYSKKSGRPAQLLLQQLGSKG
ncbi:MAG: VWA domain-containing protein [Dongiaceae bacterium]